LLAFLTPPHAASFLAPALRQIDAINAFGRFTMNDTTQTAASPAMLRPAEAAAALGVSLRTLQGLTASGQLPALKLKRAVRYLPDDLARFVAANRK
jgi:excisionase family DNA binding protein